MEGLHGGRSSNGAVRGGPQLPCTAVCWRAEQLLHKAEEYLGQRDAEAGAAASGAPSSGSAAPDQDARLLEGIDAFMGSDSAPKAEDRDDPMEGPPAAEPAAGSAAPAASKKEESSSEELVADEPARSLQLQARCRGGSRRLLTWRLRA